jgi:hypothetical protein
VSDSELRLRMAVDCELVIERRPRWWNVFMVQTTDEGVSELLSIRGLHRDHFEIASEPHLPGYGWLFINVEPPLRFCISYVNVQVLRGFLGV